MPTPSPPGWGWPTVIPVVTLILPPGISFYTFHTISYTADIYRGKFAPHNKLIDYITFVAFFPQLVAGPIARASDLLPQIAAKRPRITWAQAEMAIWLICWGLFKKITLADNFGHLVELIEPRIQPDNIIGRSRLAVRLCLRRPDLLRFFRLYRHRPRSRQTLQYRADAKLPDALFCVVALRLLAALAYFPVDLAARLSLHPVGRGATWPAEDASESRHHDVPGRPVAWRRHRLRHLGPVSRPAADHLSSMPVSTPFSRRPSARASSKAIAIFVMFQLVCIGWIFFRATPAELAAGVQVDRRLLGMGSTGTSSR